jgi:cysteinyl-tRNA synthetase
MFNKGQTELRVSLLEERVQTYDEISKQMLEKLEQAVERISESTRDISQILIRHEERIEKSAEVNQSTIQIIDRVEKSITEDLAKVEERVNSLSGVVENLKKQQWLWVGVLAATSFFIGYVDKIQSIQNPPPAPTINAK